MKLALLLSASVASVAFAGTINSPYQVGTWQGFRTAAVSYTFDDDLPNQYSIAVPMFNAKGFKLTLFTVTGWLGGNYSNVKTAASYGHEIASHTVDHATMSSLSNADQTSECANSQSAINANVTNQKCVTLAYPGCAVGNESIVSQYYIAARICSGQIVPSTPSDFMTISSLICGSAGGIQTATDFNNAANNAASSGGWCVYLIHALDNDNGYSPLPSSVLQSSVNYMDANRSTFWVQTFGNVVRYIRERNAVNVAETGSTSTTLTVSVTDSLDNSIYNFPVTIRRPLPSGWSSATASQGGKDLGAQIVTVSGTMYVMFDAVPNGGNVTITSTGSGGLANGTYKLIARHSGKALDAYGANTTNGTQIIQWTYNAGNNQKWTVTSLGSSLYKIIGVQSGRSIDISNWGTANGTKVQLWDYLGGTNQKFYFNATSGGYYEISPSHCTGSCLDVSGASTADGAIVQLWQWLSGNNQQWIPQAP
jgi:oligosaccharide reducing-end xylanase